MVVGVWEGQGGATPFRAEVLGSLLSQVHLAIHSSTWRN